MSATGESQKLSSDPIGTEISFLKSISPLFKLKPKLFSSHLLTFPTTHPLVFNLLGRRLPVYFIFSTSKEGRTESNNLLRVRGGCGGAYFHRQSGPPSSLWSTPKSPEHLKAECPSWCFSKLFTRCLLVKMPIVLQEAHNPTASWVIFSITVL